MRARAPSETLLASLCLATIVILSLLVVVMAANRPSLLSPTTHTAFYPALDGGPARRAVAGPDGQRHDPEVPVQRGDRG